MRSEPSAVSPSLQRLRHQAGWEDMQGEWHARFGHTRLHKLIVLADRYEWLKFAGPDGLGIPGRYGVISMILAWIREEIRHEEERAAQRQG